MIEFLLDGEVIHTLDDRAYRKKTLNVDFHNPAGSVQSHDEVAVPVQRDLQINLYFGPRADTDLAMLEEDKRELAMDIESGVEPDDHSIASVPELDLDEDDEDEDDDEKKSEGETPVEEQTPPVLDL